MTAAPGTTGELAQWLAYIESRHPQSIAMGLDRVARVGARMGLGRPARHVITVAGTNGKGSTVAFIEAMARAAGWRVGAYTSPHLRTYNERVRIDGVDAVDADLVAAFAAVEAARTQPADRPAGAAEGDAADEVAGDAGGEVALTYFEFGTLAALWLFARDTLDLAILEVGMGGRLDATNWVDPDVAVITTVDLDHQDYLGSDREAIGVEKAGIARPWRPLVIGDDDPPSSVLGHAYAIGASALRIGCDFFFAPLDAGGGAPGDDPALPTADPARRPMPAAGGWQWHEVGHSMVLPAPALAAPAQMRNAAVAIAALRALAAEVPDAAIAAGVANARLPGRLQAFRCEGGAVFVDVAHNPQAARELAGWLRAHPVAGPTIAVFAALGDKDLAGVVGPLEGLVDNWHLAGLPDVVRGLPVAEFAARLRGTSAAAGMRHDGVRGALDAALAALSAGGGGRVLVFGSFHTAAAALELLEPLESPVS